MGFQYAAADGAVCRALLGNWRGAEAASETIRWQERYAAPRYDHHLVHWAFVSRRSAAGHQCHAFLADAGRLGAPVAVSHG